MVFLSAVQRGIGIVAQKKDSDVANAGTRELYGVGFSKVIIVSKVVSRSRPIKQNSPALP